MYVATGPNRDHPSPTIEYKLDQTSTGTCVTCIFPVDSSANGCVAVVHQQISQLSSSGLLNIESSHKFTRSGDTAYGCIEINLEGYELRVIGGQLHVHAQGTYTMCNVLPQQEYRTRSNCSNILITQTARLSIKFLFPSYNSSNILNFKFSHLF